MIDNKALFKFTYGLFALTAKEGDKDNGCIINSAMQQTSNPLTISVTVNKQNLTHDMIASTGRFNLSVLTVDTPFEIFQNFGMQSGKNTDKFISYNFKRSDNGILFLNKFSNAYFSATVINSVDFGTHTLFLADVTEAETISQTESLSYGYYHKNIKPNPIVVKQAENSSWRCKICGYVYENTPLPKDFVCPICKHGEEDFELVK